MQQLTDVFQRLLAATEEQNQLLREQTFYLKAIAADSPPNFTYPLKAFREEKWVEQIRAKVVFRDSDGIASVRWCGCTYHRRTGPQKYGADIWFSRSRGKADDSAIYARLITFYGKREQEPPEAVGDHVKKSL